MDLKSLNKTRTVVMDNNFYTGYRKNIVAPNEVLVSITIPYTSENQYFIAYKQARRRDDDIAIVNSAFWFDISQESKVITDCAMSFGGMAPTTVMALETMEFLKEKKWSAQTIEDACDILLKDLPLPPGVPGAMVRYRQSLTVSFLFKAYLTVSKLSDLTNIPSEFNSATQIFHKDPIESHQLFDIQAGNSEVQPVGKSVKHKSADKQATGEAVYIDDMPRFEDELYLAFVLSTKAHANIVNIDFSVAKEVSGVVDFLSAEDLPRERNEYHMIIKTDEISFAKDKVHCVGQTIAAVVAKDQVAAQRAAKLVKVTYEELPAIITIEEAIAAGSYHHWDGNRIKRGNIEEALAKSDHVIEGSMRTGAQEHFYLETNACIAVPTNEDGEMHVYASTQNPTETQMLVSHALGVPMHKVVCKVKRMGGGFGGKETRSVPVSMVCALAAAKTQKPVRVMLDRDEDMLMSGHRHPFMAKYKVGFSKEGKVKALDVDIYNNAGYTMDLSFSVMERALFHSDNSYNIETVDLRGHCCKTNLQSNTAFRGFGGPQGLMMAETWMDEISTLLKKDPLQIRELNMYRPEGDVTHFNQPLVNCTIRRCWEECKKQSDYSKQEEEVRKFNAKNRWKKRGISMVPVKFGIAFTAPHLNQSGALVQIYKDGSVLLTHGGTEMGQGLHTKMIQVASQVLRIPHYKVHISETGTDKVPNTSPTAASAGSDLNGMAVQNACETLYERLQPYREKYPDEKWETWVTKAYFDRISLSSTGFYATPNLGYNFKTNTGNAFNYFTFGVGCSVVEIDCLTGDHDVLRTDIVMDLGESLNPAIDIGQIEGAFVQGYGLFVMEQLVHSPQGQLWTRGPGAYKIPGFGDIPAKFNVSLLRGAPNPRAVFSSKAVGEPPLFLAASAFFAIKNAIR